ncbi:MAG: hypothetical protein QG632_793, partial [Candidatus Dependentiae bacterium]|nr:hypothetical protein [Candidatus Dependentiae bacterium]
MCYNSLLFCLGTLLLFVSPLAAFDAVSLSHRAAEEKVHQLYNELNLAYSGSFSEYRPEDDPISFAHNACDYIRAALNSSGEKFKQYEFARRALEEKVLPACRAKGKGMNTCEGAITSIAEHVSSHVPELACDAVSGLAVLIREDREWAPQFADNVDSDGLITSLDAVADLIALQYYENAYSYFSAWEDDYASAGSSECVTECK